MKILRTLAALCCLLVGCSLAACSAGGASDRATELAIQHIAENGGWHMVSMFKERTARYDFVVLRSKVTENQRLYGGVVEYYYILERCEFNEDTLKAVRDCHQIALVETVKPDKS